MAPLHVGLAAVLAGVHDASTVDTSAGMDTSSAMLAAVSSLLLLLLLLLLLQVMLQSLQGSSTRVQSQVLLNADRKEWEKHRGSIEEPWRKGRGKKGVQHLL